MSHRRTSSRAASTGAGLASKRTVPAEIRPPAVVISNSEDDQPGLLVAQGRFIESPAPSPSKELNHPTYGHGLSSSFFRAQQLSSATALISSTTFGAAGTPGTFPATPTPGRTFDFSGNPQRDTGDQVQGVRFERDGFNDDGVLMENEGKVSSSFTLIRGSGDIRLNISSPTGSTYSKSGGREPARPTNSFIQSLLSTLCDFIGHLDSVARSEWRRLRRFRFRALWSLRGAAWLSITLVAFLVLIIIWTSGDSSNRLVREFEVDGKSPVKIDPKSASRELWINNRNRTVASEGLFANVLARLGLGSPERKVSRERHELGSNVGREVERVEENLLGLGRLPRRYEFGNYQGLTFDEDGLLRREGLEGWREAGDKPLAGRAPPSDDILRMSYRAGQRRYEKEEPFWTEWVWEKPEVDESLMRILGLLSDDELSFRSWILQMRQRPHPLAKSLGLSSSTPAAEERYHVNLDDLGSAEEQVLASGHESEDSEKVSEQLPLQRRAFRLADNDPSASRPVRARVAKDSAVLLQDGPPEFQGGSLIKWAWLDQEAREELGGTCDGSTWLADYKDLHEEMILGERPPKVISYTCESGMSCGGLGERMMAMASGFLFALVTNRAFFAEWQNPVGLDVAFDSPYIDWSMSSYTLEQHPIFSNETLSDFSADLDIVNFDSKNIASTFEKKGWNGVSGGHWTKGMERRDLAFQSPWIRLFANTGFVYQSFSFPHLQKRLRYLGLRPTSALSCIVHYLFRPKPAALDFINEYTSVLSLPSIFSVGVEIQTREAIDDAYKAFFKCADHLTEMYSTPDQTVVYFLVTDSERVRQLARKWMGDKLMMSGLTETVSSSSVKGPHQDSNIVYTSIIDNYILSETDYKVVTKNSTFGKLASLLTAHHGTTVALPATSELINRASNKIDCRLESAFHSFQKY